PIRVSVETGDGEAPRGELARDREAHVPLADDGEPGGSRLDALVQCGYVIHLEVSKGGAGAQPCLEQRLWHDDHVTRLQGRVRVGRGVSLNRVRVDLEPDLLPVCRLAVRSLHSVLSNDGDPARGGELREG